MGLKDLFIVSNKPTNDNSSEKPVKENVTKFPNSEPQNTGFFNFGNKTQTTPVFQGNQPSAEQIEHAIKVYQNGFDSLNQNGYDFYEFFKSVVHGGLDNPQIYNMAFAMGLAMDKTITKTKLLQQSDFYINEITKFYNENLNKGNLKKQELINQKTSENQALISELSMLKQQLEALQTQIQDRENKLGVNATKYEPMLSEIDSKLMANEMAKNQLVDSIEKVKSGINSNIN